MTITQTGRRLALVGLLALIGAVLPLTGASAISGTEALQLSAGDNVATSIANSQVLYTPVDGTPDTPPTEALIGRSDLFADNLASGALQTGRPLLLNDETEGVNADVLAELDRLLGGTGTVHILGGTAAQGEGVETALTDAGYTPNRFEGPTRTETAIAIATASGADTALLVRSEAAADSTDTTQAYADALGAGALAATNGYSVLFTQTDELTATTAEYLGSEDGPSTVIIVGGTAAVSETVETAVGELVDTVSRAAGPTRFDTAIELNNLRDGDLGDFAIAVEGQAADAWADGFTMANLSASGNYPLVLTNNGDVPAATETYLDSINENAFAAHLAETFIVCGSSIGDACAALAALYGLTVVPFPPVDEPGAANAGIVVDTNGVDEYTFVPDGGDTAVTIIADTADDDFFVDDSAASSGIFFSSIGVCDYVTFNDGGAADGEAASHELENRDCDDITSGTVGEVDLVGGFFSIIEPVTGTPLRTGIDFFAVDNVHFVDGTASSLDTFGDDINEGDDIEIQDETPTESQTTLMLTNNVVSGLVNELDTPTAFDAFFSLGGLGDNLMGGDFFAATDPAGPAPGTEVYNVDGEEVDFADFYAAISNGDEGTYQRAGNEETFSLGNLAPPLEEGVVTTPLPAVLLGDGGTVTYIPTGADAVDTIDYTAGAAFIVDGLLVAENVFEGALTPGDVISYRPADAGTGTTERVVLTNEGLSGFLEDGTPGAGYSLDVYDENDVLIDTYVPAAGDRWFLDGVQVTEPDFEAEIDDALLEDGYTIDIVETVTGNDIMVTTPA